MTRIISTAVAAASSVGTTTTILAPRTSYEELVVQLTNLGATAATVVLLLHRAGDEAGSYFRISPSAIALDVEGDNGANLAEVTIPGLNSGDTLKITSTSEDADVTIQVLLWGKSVAKF